MNKNFALIGSAGYIAPRHLDAIKKTNNNLIASLDKSDSVGIIDSYFPNSSFFTEFERFDRHLNKLKYDKGIKLDYTTICSPNYLHDSHIRTALRWQSNAICEKPLVLNPWNIDALKKIESETGKQVYTILQLRLHDSVIKLKEKINKQKGKVFDVDLTYITSRGLWYYASWKGNEDKSGGIATNIGIHFFDMLGYVFGKLKSNVVHLNKHDRASGFLEFENARVRWFLSINENLLPKNAVKNNLKTYRSISIEGEEFEFSKGFTDLHKSSYEMILKNEGFKLDENYQAIEIAYKIRGSKSENLTSDCHPFALIKTDKHPFN
tara:strand:- start:61 stop:1026 length:966 start_codon:yes stop_codon:yes gene_type:complete